MSRFDDELRRAAEPLAEPMPTDLLDESLDAPPGAGRRVGAVATVAFLAVLLVAAGIGIGQVLPVPEPDAFESPSPDASQVVGLCEPFEPVPTAGTVLVFFPCAADPTGPLVARQRPASMIAGPAERLELAIEALLAGPTEEEVAGGLTGIVPGGLDDLVLATASTDDGVGQVVFMPELLEINNLSASLAGSVFLRAVEATGLASPEITALDLWAANGGCEALFAFFQRDCELLVEPLPELPCAVIEPAELPNSEPAGTPHAYPGQPLVVWGTFEETVLEAVTDAPAPEPGGTPVEVRGHPGWVRPAGDLPLPEPMEITWAEGGCTYSIFVGLQGDGEPAAVDYAARIGRSIAEPSVPPAEAVQHQHEELGIRLTIELDRDRTVPGLPIFATATVENVGSEPVFWGHSSTCPHPVSISVEPLDAEPLDPGRSWTGDEEVTKRLMVNEGRDTLSLGDRFVPATWLGAEGFACTSDLATSALGPGEELVQQLAWDALGPLDMPMPGTYELTASFPYMSRGEPPGFEDSDIDAYAVRVFATVEVLGEQEAYLSPGVAFDALLDDPEYRELLADHPRQTRVGSRMRFEDGDWVAVIYLKPSGGDGRPMAVVGEVDALTGEVLGSRLEEREPPAGG